VASSSDAELARMARAIGHPARVAILRILIANGECFCGDVVRQMPLAQATVSQHLKVLKDAGLIRGNIDPPRVCYCIAPEAVTRLKALIGGL
jgi:ArsR family transcriptional regulator